MKISRIEIQDFQQFKNLDIDLTYPQGHAKAGQPLDKVCIIGQNGTGKTTILKLIHDCCIYHNFNDYVGHKQLKELPKMASIVFKNDLGDTFSFYAAKFFQDYSLKKTIDNLVYIPTNSYFINNVPNPFPKQEIGKPKTLKKVYFQLDNQGVTQFPSHLYAKILDHQQAFQNFSYYLKPDNNFNDNIKSWTIKNPDPLLEIANFIDKLLAPSGLKIKSNVKKTDGIVIIELISLKNGEIIPFDKLSSGTKNIFWTAYALYQQIENESIILIDEPENSLYPNLQRAIVPTYTSLRPDAETQFFFATHSPVIASCFEPWEIIDLELDDDNYVDRHLYYKGENHVDNYTIYPQYLRWDSILKEVFDVHYAGNPKRNEKLEEFSFVRAELNEMKRNGKTPENNKEMAGLFKRYQVLLKQLDWKTENIFSEIRSVLDEMKRNGKTPENNKEMAELLTRYQALLKQLEWKTENTNV